MYEGPAQGSKTLEEGVMEILSHDELTQVVVRLWAIWHARRKEIHQHSNPNPVIDTLFY
jgi:hypothetical protein